MSNHQEVEASGGSGGSGGGGAYVKSLTSSFPSTYRLHKTQGEVLFDLQSRVQGRRRSLRANLWDFRGLWGSFDLQGRSQGQVRFVEVNLEHFFKVFDLFDLDSRVQGRKFERF